MAYLCKAADCGENATTRVCIRGAGVVISHIDVCDKHAQWVVNVAKAVPPTVEITPRGYISVTEDGEEINKGSVH